jgi:hypothetical protein
MVLQCSARAVVGRIVEEPYKARGGRLGKAYPRCSELTTSAVQEHVERRYRGCSGVHTAAAVPVDLAATACERPLIIEVVVEAGMKSVSG